MVRSKQAANQTRVGISTLPSYYIDEIFPSYIIPPDAQFPPLQKSGDTPILRGPDTLNVNPP